MRARALFVVVAAAALGVVVACSSFSSGEPAPVDDAGSDGAAADDASDAPSSSDALDAAADAVANLVSNGNFELQCAGWSVSQAAVTNISAPDGDVRGGTGSCRVCGSSGAAPFFFYQNVNATIPLGAQFYGELWVHAATGFTSPPTVGARVAVLGADGGVLQFGTLADTTVDGTWRVTTSLVDVSVDSGTMLQLELREALKDTCVIVDDARLYQTQ